MNSIGRHLKRTQKSQRRFADECHVSQPTVSAWVRGAKKPEGENLDRVAQILGIDRADLLLEFHLGKSSPVSGARRVAA